MILRDILKRGRWLRAREAGVELPIDPSLDDFKKEAFRIAQLGKQFAGEIKSSDRGRFLKAIAALEDPYLSSKK